MRRSKRNNSLVDDISDKMIEWILYLGASLHIEFRLTIKLHICRAVQSIPRSKSVSPGVKGLFALFQVTLYANMTGSNLQRFNMNLRLIKYELYSNDYNYENWLFLIVLSLLQINVCELSKLNPLNLEKQKIFHIIDLIKVSRVPLWNGHCHFCTEGHMKIDLQSL